MLSPASLTLKFDAILDASSPSLLPSQLAPVSYSYDPAPVVEEIGWNPHPSGASTLIASPGTTGHAEIPRRMSPPPDLPEAIVVDTATTATTGTEAQYVYAQPARSVRSSSSLATARERPQYERAKAQE
ncbi:hypothetical protein RhiXN_00254 [Rhizoctonia solani]|uniref:Uncharacterized protein n=1 Tax=Rhizoctonia solani TaxID=456999 RepID=A0A8H8NV15_9AGAM|nr:uncharacterized protein RhiXN_00254 [Rhizoctonia solani]QRW18848.1 hypothetical protein RhiXN_00254 [Rhizoctonia solani]